MRIDHAALWTDDLERASAFYEEFFEARSSARYRNERTGFESTFVAFADGARLELMQKPGIGTRPGAGEETLGYAHLALSLGSEAAVDALTGRLAAAGRVVVDGPRRTGDGYYESVVLDPDGNRIELTV